METARVLLIIVDTPTHRVLINRFLSGTPHHLVFASDGEDAYDRFAEVKPDLVLAYLHASRLDGGLLCQLVRQRLGGTSVPFVLIGDETSESEGHRRANEVDADQFIVWPTTESELRGPLEPLLQHGRSITDVKHRSPLADGPTGPALPIPSSATLHAIDGNPGPATESTPFSVETDDLGDPGLPAESNEIDTVVSFKNPFFAEHGEAVVEFVKSSGGSEEQVTHVAIEAPSLQGLPGDPSTLMDPVVVVENTETQVAAKTVDPLEEPRINTNAGPAPTARPQSRLIAEVPREQTPTGDSDARPPPPTGARRGLDESQLGKRLAKRVRSMYRRLDEATYYQLLDVEVGSDYDRIRRAYYELSLEFHPDRFFLLRSGDLKEKIYAVYRKIAEAFRVLSDDQARADYDARATHDPATLNEPAAEVLRPALPATARSEAAKRYVDLAQDAYASGDMNHARLMLALAQSSEKDNSSLREALDLVVQTTSSMI